MKTIKIIVIVFSFLFTSQITSQNRDRRYDRKVKTIKKQNKVDEANDNVSNTQKRIDSTKSNVKSTIDKTKETINDITSIFKSKNKKAKKKKTVKTVLITVNNVEYGNANLKDLQKVISKAKGVKGASKNFENNIATIRVNYKKGGDNLWESLSDKVRSSFKVSRISDDEILISLKE